MAKEEKKTTALTGKVAKFLASLEKQHKFIKKHGNKFFYSWARSKKTFKKAKAAALAGKRSGLTCVVPCRWALRAAGIDPTGFWGYKGTFRGYSKNKKMKKYLKRIRKGGPIGMTVKQAHKADKLRDGDILAFKDKTHTVVYSGKGCKVYDGGGAAERRGYGKVGILLNYGKVKAWNKKKISEVLRWR